MNVLEIPFVKKIGITKNKDEQLQLAYGEDVYNHLDTIHASAQFTLAETASGEFLQILYPHLAGKVIPLLRGAEVKFKKPAFKTIMAFTSVTDEAREKFETQFAKKGRASIRLDVDVKDIENTLTSSASYNWFIQKLDT